MTWAARGGLWKVRKKKKKWGNIGKREREGERERKREEEGRRPKEKLEN